MSNIRPGGGQLLLVAGITANRFSGGRSKRQETAVHTPGNGCTITHIASTLWDTSPWCLVPGTQSLCPVSSGQKQLLMCLQQVVCTYLTGQRLLIGLTIVTHFPQQLNRRPHNLEHLCTTRCTTQHINRPVPPVRCALVCVVVLKKGAGQWTTTDQNTCQENVGNRFGDVQTGGQPPPAPRGEQNTGPP